MFWDAGLVASIGVCAGIAIELLGRRVEPSRRAAPALALCAALWCAGELLLRHLDAPGDILWARRVLFAGVCLIGPCMLALALRLHEGPVTRPARALLGAATLFEAFVYATLYTDQSAWFISGPSGDPARGPLFAFHAVVQWSLIVVAVGLLANAALRVRGPGRLGAAMVLAGAGLPLLLNWIYFAFDVPAYDPTPLALAVGALSIRWGLDDLVGVGFLAALARSELIDQLDAGVFVADQRGWVLEANERARAMLPAMEPVGAHIGDLLAVFTTDPGFDVRRFPLLRHGHSVGVGAIVNDRRGPRAAEQSAEVATRMEALGVLTRGLAHEIDNPLGAVMGSAELLGETLREEHGVDLDRSEPGRYLRMLEESADRISQVVRRMELLADPAAADESAPEVAEVRGVAEHAIALACLGKSRDRVRLHAPGEPVHAAARPTELLQILLHAIGNALESYVDGASRVDVEIRADDAVVTVGVLDRGPGLPAGDASKLFHPFYTTKRPGRGLGMGLSLAWELARQSGGTLEALAREGGGAELRLTLPAARPAPGDPSRG